MSRGNIKINKQARQAPEIDPGGTSNCPDWLSSFADELAAKEGTTIVEQTRERHNQSITEQISAIMNGGTTTAKGSVEDLVADYQHRTGFSEYSKLSSAADAAMLVIAAGDEVDEEAEKKTLAPEIFERFPGIESYINNVVGTSRRIQVPAVLHSIMETFGRDGVTDSDFDEDLKRFIFNLVKDNSESDVDYDALGLGRGVGIEDEPAGPNDTNKDPFAGLRPSSDS